MLPFGVTIPATVPQGSEILEGLMNNPVDIKKYAFMWTQNENSYPLNAENFVTSWATISFSNRNLFHSINKNLINWTLHFPLRAL